MAVRGGPLIRRVPVGAWKTLLEKGERLASNSMRRFPERECQTI